MVTQLTLVLTLSLGIGFGIGFKFCRILTILPLPPTLPAIQNSRLSDGCKIQLFLRSLQYKYEFTIQIGIFGWDELFGSKIHTKVNTKVLP